MRGIAALFAGVLAMGTLSTVHAETYPARPVRLVVGYAAGGPVDTTARQVAQHLSTKLGQPVVVENKPGAGAVLATHQVAKAPPDGYTLMFSASPPLTITPHVQKAVPFDPLKDFSFISLVVDYSNVLVVNNNTPAKDVMELVKYAKANPTAVSFGSAGVGASNHLSGELLKKITGAPMVHVPYKGNAPAMTDVMGGQITFMFDITGTALNYIRSGKVRALAVTSSQRNKSLPEVPTMVEAGVPGYEVTGWYGLIGPARLPKPVVDTLGKALAAALADPAFQQQLEAAGYDVRPSTPAQFEARVKAELDLWGRVVKDAGIQPE